MKYKIIENYINDLRRKDESSISLTYIKDIKKEITNYKKELDDKSYYEKSKCYFLLALINLNMKSDKNTFEYLSKAINLLKQSDFKDTTYEAILYGYLSNNHTLYSEENISTEIYNLAKEKFDYNYDIDELIQFYLRHIEVLNIKNNKQNEINSHVDVICKLIKENKVHYLAKYYCDIGYIYLYILDNVVSAIFYLSKSLKLSIKTNQYDLENKVTILLSYSYSYLGHNINSINYLEKNLQENRFKNLNLAYKIATLSNIVSNYLEENNIEKAKKYLDFIDSIYISNDNLIYEQLKILVYTCKAKYYNEINKFKEAINCVEESKKIYLKYNQKNKINNKSEIILYKIEGDIYYKSGDYQKACELHNKGLEKSIKHNNTRYKIIFYKMLATDFEMIGDFKNSIKNIKEYINLNESWLEIQKNKYTEILLKEYDINEKENKIFELVTLKEILIDKRNKDTLTGLLNRRFLNEYKSKKLNYYNGDDETVSMLMIDIDYFKKYNDEYGHLKGDKVISEIGKILNDICNEHKGMAIRYGGEEYLLIFENKTYEESINLACKVLEKVKNLNIEHDKSPFERKLSVSIGISTNKIKNKTYEDMIDKSDKALYIAKRNGRNRYVHINDVPCLN